MHIYDDNGEPRHFGHYSAVVTDTKDPAALGRVRFRIEGLIEPSSGWTLPSGGARSSGSGQRGGFDVPEVGATIVVFFMLGDIDQPRYMGGWHGEGEAPTQAPSSTNATKVKIYETSRFLIVLNAVGGSEELLIKDKETGDLVSMKPDQLKIQATTKVTVVAPQIEIGDEGLAAAPLINGVVLASGIDSFTGATYGVLGSASTTVTAKKV